MSTASLVRRNGGVSFWYRRTGIPPARRPLEGDRTADVCIAGAGFTGLWTAYYLKRARPDLEIVVVEREFAGFGASGRNGGWVSDHFAGSREAMTRSHGRDAFVALKREMHGAVDEVLSVCAAERIEADLVKPGMLLVARSPAQEARMRASLVQDRAQALSPGDLVGLEPRELDERVRVAGARFGVFSRQCARAQPARLVTGLASAVERLGVTIHEGTTALALEPGTMRTDRGQVRARSVLACLEGFTPSLAGERRTLLPLNSAMVVTDPLSERQWAEIGWDRQELLGDGAHAYVYAQRTADGRIALGGRGVPYRFGSRTDAWGITQRRTVRQLVEVLHSMFPVTARVPVDQAWCGVLGVRRDWIPTVAYDPASGVGLAGGYVGSGVAATNLAGRVLRDLVLGERTELTRLPWVRSQPRSWEPEPLRWLGARLVYGLYRAADRQEDASGEPRLSPLARLADLISGR